MNGERKRTSPWIPLWIAGLTALALSTAARAAAGDTVADRVLGQQRFTTSVPYFVNGRVFGPADVAIDRSVVPNRVYVADANLNRVLGWSDVGRFRAGASADLVLGQETLWDGSLIQLERQCPGVPLATNFCVPGRLAVDPGGNLYVVDRWNYRVLEFDSPFTADRTADRVFGQPDFTTRTRPPVSFAQALPLDVAVDAAGNVWMIDPAGSGSVLELDAPPTHDTLPDRVIGAETASGCARLCSAYALAVSPAGDLSVGATDGKLLVFRQPLATDLVADVVLQGPAPVSGIPGLAFDAAGDLYFLTTAGLQRYRAPITAASVPEVVAGALPGQYFDFQPAFDSGGNLFVAAAGHFDEFVWVYGAGFQAPPSRIGRPQFTNRGLRFPNAVAVDRSSSPNHLFVADGDNRVLGWRDAAGFGSGAPADLILNANGFDAVSYSPVCGAGATGLCLSKNFYPGGLAVDSRGNLWVSDLLQHRVLEFDRPFDTDVAADRVLGQGGSFNTVTCNLHGRNARSLCFPGPLALDGKDNLYVADLGNNRLLLFKDPLRGDDAADRVFGQTGFRQGQCNQGLRHPTASTLCLGIEENPNPTPDFSAASGLATDARGNLYVSDSLNSRVLIFLDPLSSDTVADRVLGQDGRFTTAVRGTGARRFGPYNGGPIGPSGLAVGPGGELFVADTGNDRVLEFDRPLKRDVPDRVFGHAGFNAPGTRFDGSQEPPPATASDLLRPIGLAVDDEGNLYVADSYYNRVLAFDRP